MFSYDASGKVVALDYSSNGGSSFTTYYYLRNAQGDIVKLIDGSGATVVEYLYDTWGKLLEITGTLRDTVGTNQPFRYRGYVYDNETGWYYLESRYYNPEIGRFISADVVLSTGQGVLGHNTYAYCLNNPVNMSDSEGDIGLFTVFSGVVGAIAGGVVGAISGVLDSLASGEDLWTCMAAGAADGAIYGLVTGVAVGFVADTVATAGGAAAIMIAAGVAGGVLGEMASSRIKGEKADVVDYMIAGFAGGLGSIIGFGMGNGLEGAKAAKKGFEKILRTHGTSLGKKLCKAFLKDKLQDSVGDVVYNITDMILRNTLRRNYDIIYSTIYAE